MLVPPGENDDTSGEPDTNYLAANLSIKYGAVGVLLLKLESWIFFSKFACDELWTHSFPLHFRLRPHLHPSSTSKSVPAYHPSPLIRELGMHFSALSVHNRKNLFVYCGGKNSYYLRFREDIHPSLTTNSFDESLNLNESHSAVTEQPSSQISTPSMKNRQRHDSVREKEKEIPTSKGFDLIAISRVHSVFM